MSVPICRSCCAKTGRTVLINSLSKCPDTGQSNRQFSKHPNQISRDEWNFIRNFGNEMYKNYLLMRSLKKDKTCNSRLSQGLRPATAGKFVPEKTAKKAVKKSRLKVLPSIPFIHNFDFLKKLNFVVGAGAGAAQLSIPLKAQQLRTYEDSSGGKLRAAGKFPKIATTVSQPFYKLASGGPVNAASPVLDRLPAVGRVHANWFGHDIGYKMAPGTGAVALDFVTSPTAALTGQRNEALESKIPKEGFRTKTSTKTKDPRGIGFVSKYRAFGYSDGQERNLRYYDLMRMESFRRKRADLLKYGFAPGIMRDFGLPMYTGEVPDELGYVEDDAAYIQHIDHLDPESFRYAADTRQNYLNPNDGDIGDCNKEAIKYLTRIGVLPEANVKGTVDGSQSTKARSTGGLTNDRHSKYVPFVEFPRQALHSDLEDMEAYEYLRHFGGHLHGNFARTTSGLREFEDSNYLRHTADLQRDSMADAAGMFDSAMPSKYLLYGGEPRQSKKADYYKQFRQFGDPRHGTFVGTAGLGYVDEFDYPYRTVEPRLVDMMGPAYGMGDVEATRYLKDTGDRSGEFERRKYTSRTQANVSAAATASKYIGNSGYLRENRIHRRRKVGPFTNKKFARYLGQTGVPGIVGATGGRDNFTNKKFARYPVQPGVPGIVGATGGRNSFEVIKRPSINLRTSQTVRRETGFFTQEPPRYIRHTLIPRREDSSGIEADLAYIREKRLHKQSKTAAEGPLMHTRFPGYEGRTFGTLPAKAGLGSIRRSFIPYTQTRRFGSFPGYNFRDPRFSRYSRPPRQGTINDFRYGEAAKNMRSFRMPFQRPPYLDYFRDSTYSRHPMIRRRKRFTRYGDKISQNFEANSFGGDPYGMGYFETPSGNIQTDPLLGSRFGKQLRKSEKNVDQENENMQILADFLAQEQEGYIYDPGYTGHFHPFYSRYKDSVNYGLNELHQLNTVILSPEEQRERDSARLKSLNLFYNIINFPDMEMEVLVPEDTTSFDYDREAKLAHIEEKKLSLIHVAKLLKGDRKRRFFPVVFHEPFDKEKPWTWIQNFPIRIPNEVLKRLPAHLLQSLKTWQRQQALMWEKPIEEIPLTLKRDKKRRRGSK
ncbi:uncharacterized protein LOC105208722 isoform X2 [Zeugodacus cucurbitae]|uniref:uncharacterized protein LOC105208722 isoform X2 n=1 Tax=Zeugodacus cucurbitae TaxID=28588 RepID=UPI0023D91F6B|nr:uncharacterized protein LOC105208722 isoform X2 [Zeugodacus cucurbitae]